MSFLFMIASLQSFRPDPVNLDCLVQIYNVSFLMLELNTAQMTVMLYKNPFYFISDIYEHNPNSLELLSRATSTEFNLVHLPLL